MAVKKSVEGGAVVRDSGADYFGLAKSLKSRINACSKEADEGAASDVVFLWACVSGGGLKQGMTGVKSKTDALSVDQWLSVVDEAASLGANWLVLSVADPLTQCSGLWPVCLWAQHTHNMMVGLHLRDGNLAKEDVKAIKQLPLERTRVLMRGATEALVKRMARQGIAVWSANPQPDGEKPNCQGPTRMIFLNEKGVLYTCGLVEGNDAYRMGHVFDASLKNIIHHPDAPRCVEEGLHIVTPECDGCPALIANFFM